MNVWLYLRPEKGRAGSNLSRLRLGKCLISVGCRPCSLWHRRRRYWMSANGKHKREKLTLLADVKLRFNHEEAEFVLGSPQLLAEMVAAKWITPVIKRHKLHLFDRG